MFSNLVRKLVGIPSILDCNFASGLDAGGYLLYGLGRSLRPKVCVEIGSARGLSACLIGQALKENGSGKLYAIDPHEPTGWNDGNSVDSYSLMIANLERFGISSYVEIVRDYSTNIGKTWDKEIDLLFIDGDHSYEGVKADWEVFSPHVSKFGIVVFHDTTWDFHRDSKWFRSDMGVPKFVEELRVSGYQVITIDQYCGISMVQPKLGGVPLVSEDN
ncbi:MAG: class I SAM-dependent methyltransferase [Bdellovibrionales bacterium]|nr:class I SAM-dependent methyltransferase [Bdellovibrionales bacterium]